MSVPITNFVNSAVQATLRIPLFAAAESISSIGFLLRYPFMVRAFVAAFPTSDSKDAERMTGNNIDKTLQCNNRDL
jgi:hypothetical protein